MQLRPWCSSLCEAGSEVNLAAASSAARIGPQAARAPGPEEGMAEQEASGLQVLLRTLQVGSGGEGADVAGWVFAWLASLGTEHTQSPLAASSPVC